MSCKYAGSDDLGLVPILKICDLHFSFDLYTDGILKQCNKLKNIEHVWGCNVLYCSVM